MENHFQLDLGTRGVGIVLHPLHFGIHVCNDLILFALTKFDIAGDNLPHFGINIGLDAADAVCRGDIGNNGVVLTAHIEDLEHQ